MTACPSHASDMPSIDNLDLASREEHKTHLRCAAARATRCRAVMDDAIAQYPRAVVDAATVGPASAETIAVVHDGCLSSRIGRAGHDFVLTKNLARGGFGKTSCQQAVDARNRCAPTNRAIRMRQHLDDTNKIDRM